MFKNVGTITEILQLLDDEAILILRHITSEVADWIDRNTVNCTVYTTKPSTLEESDALKTICKKSSIFIVPAIDTNYIHSKDALYVLPDCFSQSTIANVVIIAAMAKKEIKTQIVIDIEQVAKPFLLSSEPTQPCESENSASEPKAFEFTRKNELQLLREEINKRMNESYSIIRAEMTNASIERKTIPLTLFYKKNGIAQGRLRGTWDLFDPRDLPQSVDTGIVQRALSKVNEEYTVNVENAYRLIRKETLPEYQKKVSEIEAAYYKYLQGQNPGKVGSEDIRVPFSPENAIDASIHELTGYLFSIVPPGFGFSRIEDFIKDARQKIMESITRVESKFVIMSLSAEQLEDISYISKLRKAICDNNGFFEKSLIDLIDRYTGCLGGIKN